MYLERDKIDPEMQRSDILEPYGMMFEPPKLQLNHQLSNESGGQDDTVYDLSQNEISVSIEEAKKVQESSSSYFSVMSSTYVTFKVVTKSNLPVY